MVKENISERSLLCQDWGSLKKMFSTQPLDRIKDYFGVKIGIYFLWLGFYTFMLIPASICGIICLIYGGATLSKDYLSEEVCGSKIIMCPQCDINCDFWKLKEACTYTKITYLFDNDLTIFFAGFMSIWSTIYLELWKRYSAEMTHHWGLTGFDMYSEYSRPKYLAKYKKKGKISFWANKLPSLLFSFSVAISIVSIYLLSIQINVAIGY